MSESNVEPERKRAPRRVWAPVALVAVFSIYAAVYLVASRVLNRGLPDAVAAALGGDDPRLYQVWVEGTRLSPGLNGVTLRGLNIRPSAADPAAEGVLLEGKVGQVRVRGLRILPLLVRKELILSSVAVAEPYLDLDLRPPGGAEASYAKPAEGAPAEAEPAVTEEIGGPEAAIRRVRLGHLRIGDGRFRIATRGEEPSQAAVYGLMLELEELELDLSGAKAGELTPELDGITLSLDSLQYEWGDGLYSLSTDDVSVSSRDSTIVVGSLRLLPGIPDDEFFRRFRVRTDRIRLANGKLALAGVDFPRLIRQEGLFIRQITVDSLDMNLYSNLKMPYRPEWRPCRYYDDFGRIPVALRVDSILLSDSRFVYQEMAIDGTRPGSLPIGNIQATITNITNDSTRMTDSTPAVLRFHSASVFDAANVEGAFEIPLLAPGPDLRFRASAGRMDFKAWNQLVVNLAGAELTSGTLDTLWMAFESRRGRSTGEVHARYRDLNFRLFDKKSGQSKPLLQVMGFLGSVAVQKNNPSKPGNPHRVGKINYECKPEDLLFFEYWIRSIGSAAMGVAVGKIGPIG